MFPRARTPDGEIEEAGGAYVRRRLPFGDRVLASGDRLTAEEVAEIPPANLRSLINLNIIELFPKPPEPSMVEAELRAALTEKNEEIKRLQVHPDMVSAAVALWLAEAPPPLPVVSNGTCFLMPDETGKKYHIIQGRQVTDTPLNLTQARARMKELSP